MKSKLSKIFVALALLLTFITVPNVEVNAIEPKATTPILVDKYEGKTISVTDGYVYIEAHMTGTMVRNSSGTVISHDVDFEVYHADGSTYYASDITIMSKTVTKSGNGIIGTVKFSYDIIKASNGMIIQNDIVTSITLSFGV